MTTQQQRHQELRYVSFLSWSPRFDANFFSLKMEQTELLQSAPNDDSTAHSNAMQVPGKEKYPAYYYQIDIFREKKQHSVLRRYSQFQWLYQQLLVQYKQSLASGAPPTEPMVFPPKTCPWQTQDDEFAENRLEQLFEFLTDALKRPGVASHGAVVKFLELDTMP